MYTITGFQRPKELGADFAYNIRGKTQEEARKEILDGAGPIDMVIDAMGNHRWQERECDQFRLVVLETAAAHTSFFGHATCDQPVNTRWSDATKISHFRGFEPGWDVSRKVIRYGEQLVAEGRLNVKSLITHRLPLRELETGLGSLP